MVRGYFWAAAKLSEIKTSISRSYRVGSVKRRSGNLATLFVSLLAGLMLVMLSPGAPQAQVYTNDPPHPMTTDANGVDLLTGTPTVKSATVAIGPSDGGLSFSRTWTGAGPGWTDATHTGIDVNYRVLGLAEATSPATVNVGTSTDMFPPPAQSWNQSPCAAISLQSMLGTGGTLAYSCSTALWTYTARDGTIYTINPAITSYEEYLTASPRYNPFGSLVSIQKPNGEVINYNYNSYNRVQSITNNRGYQIKFVYYSNVSTQYAYRTVTGVFAINNAIDYCNPTADTCTNFNGAVGPSGTTWPSLTLGYINLGNGAQGPVLWGPSSQIDAAGDTTTYAQVSMGSGGMTETSPAGVVTTYIDGHSYVADTNSTINTASAASIVTINGQSWQYQYTCSQTSVLTIPGSNRSPNGYYCSSANVVRTNPNGGTYQIVEDLLTCSALCLSTNGANFNVIVASPYEMLTATDELSRSTNYAPDSFGRIYYVKTPLGQTSVFNYDAEGNASRGDLINITNSPISGSGLSNIVYSAAYPTSCPNPLTCNEPTSRTDANNNVTSYTYYPTTGLVLTKTSPAGANGVSPQTRYYYEQLNATYYNANGVMAQGPAIWMPWYTSTCQTAASCSGTADEVRVTYTYDGDLRPATTVTAAGDGSLSRTETYAYDSIGNLTSVTEPMGSSNAATTTVHIYDADRRKIGEIGPAPNGNGHYRAARTTYDADGRVTLAETGYTTTQSDPTLSTFASLEQAASVYDGAGRKIEDAHSGGGVTSTLTQSSYDVLDRLVCTVVRMNQSAFSGLRATYSSSYSASGVLPTAACALGTTGSDGPDRVTYRNYDAAGQLLQTVLGYGSSVQVADHTSTYTEDGKEATAADGNSNLTSYTYDGFDRLSQTHYPSPSGGGTSNPNDYEQYGYDANSNMLTRRLRDGNTISMGYDALNRLTSKTVPGANPTYITYDLLNRPTMYAFSQGGTMDALAYDALGRVTSETTNTWPMTYAYDLAGDRTQITYFDGMYINYSYDVGGELTTIQNPQAKTSPALLGSYTYDDLGRRTGVSRGSGTSTAYSYDGISRLSTLNHTMPSTYAQWNQTYTLGYTASSQLNQIVASNSSYTFVPATSSVSATPNGLNQLATVGGSTFTYDQRGNLISDGVNSYAYDTLNQLSTFNGSTTLGYDARNRLISTTVNGGTATQFVYVGDQLAVEFQVAGSTATILRRYMPGVGEDRPIAMYNSNTTTNMYELLEDHAGSIVAINAAQGDDIHVNRYDAYGVPGPNNWGRYQYTGQVWLSEVGLYNYKARLYSPTLGRFMQTDPVGYKDGLNWYEYTHNDPLNGTDPTGRADCTGSNIDCGGGLAPGVSGSISFGAGHTESSAQTQSSMAAISYTEPRPEPVGDGQITQAGDRQADGTGDDAELIAVAEHTKGARPSTEGKHEKGDARRGKDQGGEKGDKARDPPRQRPQGYKGPWPPKGNPGVPFVPTSPLQPLPPFELPPVFEPVPIFIPASE